MRGGLRTKLISPDTAVGLVRNGDTLAVGGFVGLGVPEQLLCLRFFATDGPRDLTLIFAAGQAGS